MVNSFAADEGIHMASSHTAAHISHPFFSDPPIHQLFEAVGNEASAGIDLS